MIMDPRIRCCAGSQNGILCNHPVSFLSDQNIVAGPRYESSSSSNSTSVVDQPRFRDFRYLEPDPPPPSSVGLSSSVNHEDDHDDCDFSDVVLRYISEMLMEEDMEDKTCMLQDSLELQTAEKSLYEVIGKKYPPSPENYPSYESVDGDLSGNCSNYASTACDSCLVDNSWTRTIPGEYNQAQNLSVYSTSEWSFSSSNSVANAVDGLVDSPDSTLQISDLYRESQSVWQFKKGVEEASKFLPTGNDLFLNLELNGSVPWEPKVETSEEVIKIEKHDDREYSPSGLRRKKNPHREDVDLEEERSSKQAAVFTESTLRSEMFDEVLLCALGNPEAPMVTFRDSLQNGKGKNMQQNVKTKGFNSGKGRGKKNGKKEVIDLRTLLISCAQAVAADDRRSSNELLKQIRQHSSPFGDGNQRLAHCFADGLEARLAGNGGSQIHKCLVSKRTPAADILKAYRLYLAACPFRKLSHFVSNKTIRELASNSMRLHIIDFGILYGFQWPTFIQLLSTRHGGPPMLRITGIDFPQPGFRPAERVEETGRRLADYAKTFNVPFEYNAIAKKWETIQLEELKIDRDEVLVVNSIYRFKNLLDETVAVDSSRTIVLNTIRKINPDLFIHGIVNGAYNAPFFVTRFREAVFHFSAMFDMLETIVPREYYERMLLEKEIFGKEALNVIACEGWERVERPETYKQWQARNLRAGFRQLPFDREIIERATKRVVTSYHKDFVVDEDSRWFLQGWKGRTIYALSCWKPV